MKVIAKNKKARFNYEIISKFEAGIVLTGSEIKSIRQGHVSLDESFVRVNYKNEMVINNMYIKHYDHAHSVVKNHERGQRKLLMHKKEIKKLKQEVKESGYSLVPSIVYFKGNYVKVEVCLAKGKKVHDKRRALKEKDIQRDIEKQLKER